MIMNSPSAFLDDNSIFEKLTKMQHYGLPTRLLDLTENPCVALYFACENNPKAVGEVILYEPKESNEKFFYSPEIKSFSFEDKSKGLFFVHSKFNNRRIASQSGLFLLFAEKEDIFSVSLNECYKKTNDHKQIILYIPCNKKAAIKKSLERINIRKKSLFLELNDIAEDLKESYSKNGKMTGE